MALRLPTTKRGKLALYLTCALLPMALFVLVALLVYSGPCPDAGEVQRAMAVNGEMQEYCALRGVRHGPFIQTTSEGQRTVEGHFVDGAEHGPWRYYSGGMLDEMKCFSRGNVVWTTRDKTVMQEKPCNESDQR